MTPLACRLRLVLPLVVTIFAACAGFEEQTTLLVPSNTGSTSSTPDPVSGGSSTGTLIGSWSSASGASGFAIPDVSTCGEFQWQVSSQSATAMNGAFTARCGGNLTIAGTGTGAMTGAQHIDLSVNGTAIIGGFAACNFSVSGTGTLVDRDTLTIPYSGTTCLGPVRGTETLRRRSATPPPPPPADDPPPPPPPPPPSNPAPGGFDLGRVTIVGSPDVRGWPITSRITALRFGGGQIFLDHTRRGTWPPVVIANDGTTQEATLWVFFNVNGRWYGTGAERWRPGQTTKALTKPSDIGPGWLYDPSRWGPMANYVPRPGELVGFMVAAGSTRSDASINVAERSPVILVPFPSDSGGAFPPFAWEEQ